MMNLFFTTARAATYTIENPLGAGTTFQTIIDRILKGLQDLIIPVAVLMIMWAGYYFLTAAGQAGRIKKGKDILQWAVIGLVIFFIGSGFIDLIKSILGVK